MDGGAVGQGDVLFDEFFFAIDHLREFSVFHHDIDAWGVALGRSAGGGGKKGADDEGEEQGKALHSGGFALGIAKILPDVGRIGGCGMQPIVYLGKN